MNPKHAELVLSVKLNDFRSFEELQLLKDAASSEVERMAVPYAAGSRSSKSKMGALTVEVKWKIGLPAVAKPFREPALSALGSEQAVLWVLQHYATSDQDGIDVHKIHQYLAEHGKAISKKATKSAAERLRRKSTTGVRSRKTGTRGRSAMASYYWPRLPDAAGLNSVPTDAVLEMATASNGTAARDALAKRMEAYRDSNEVLEAEIISAIRECGGTDVMAHRLKTARPWKNWKRVRSVLKNLAQRGEVVITGERRATRYSLVDTARAVAT